jgi:hypothetical protein
MSNDEKDKNDKWNDCYENITRLHSRKYQQQDINRRENKVYQAHKMQNLILIIITFHVDKVLVGS